MKSARRRRWLDTACTMLGLDVNGMMRRRVLERPVAQSDCSESAARLAARFRIGMTLIV
jgi:hypothetical protein